MIKHSIPPITRTDKLCLIALAGILITATLFQTLIDGAHPRAADSVEVDKPSALTITAPPIDATPLLEAIEAARESAQADQYDDTIPLDRGIQAALREACEDNNVPLCLALGLIEVESDFDPYAENGVSYGLCQLNMKYWPEGLTPEGNIVCGISYLGELLERYDDEAAALRAYNFGYDDGDRRYAKAVLAASEKWGCG